MQKNVPKYTPDWVPTITLWAESSKRDVTYALCNDRRTLLWFANQRAVEYHPALVRTERLDRVTHLMLDLDPPEGSELRCGRRRGQAGPSGPGRRRPRGGGEDERGEGPARVRADRCRGHDDRGRGGGHPSDRRSQPSSSTRRSPRRHSSRTTAVARCSSTRPASVGRPSSPPTAHVLALAFRCRSRCGGTTSTPSSRRTSRSTRRSTTSVTAIRGRH